MRAKGGGLLRGLSLPVNEEAPGIGGPNGPLLTNLTAGSTPAPLVNTNFSDVALISQQQNDLSVARHPSNVRRSADTSVRSHSFQFVELDAPIDARIQPGHHRRFELVEFQHGKRKPRLLAGLFARHSSQCDLRQQPIQYECQPLHVQSSLFQQPGAYGHTAAVGGGLEGP